MATAWQTLEEAALTLGISSRTLHRRLARGEFETRLENGRREVLLVIADPDAAGNAEIAAQVRADLSALSERAAALADAAADRPEDPPAHDAAEEVQTTMLALHEDRIRRTDLAIMAYQQSVNLTATDSRRAHRNARLAWSFVGAVAIGLFVGGIWATHTLTKAQAEVDQLHVTVRQLSDTATAKSHEADQFREQAQAARLASAKVEGELSATRQQLDQLTHLKLTASAPLATTAPSDRAGAHTAAPLSDRSPIPATQPSARISAMTDIDALIERITLR